MNIYPLSALLHEYILILSSGEGFKPKYKLMPWLGVDYLKDVIPWNVRNLINFYILLYIFQIAALQAQLQALRAVADGISNDVSAVLVALVAILCNLCSQKAALLFLTNQ